MFHVLLDASSSASLHSYLKCYSSGFHSCSLNHQHFSLFSNSNSVISKFLSLVQTFQSICLLHIFTWSHRYLVCLKNHLPLTLHLHLCSSGWLFLEPLSKFCMLTPLLHLPDIQLVSQYYRFYLRVSDRSLSFHFHCSVSSTTPTCFLIHSPSPLLVPQCYWRGLSRSTLTRTSDVCLPVHSPL